MKDIPCNLASITHSLKMVYEQLDAIEGKDLVLAISRSQNPKAGRSLLLSYLSFGPDKHEVRKVVVDESECEVVDQTQYLRRNIKQFGIGHEKDNNSHTISPQFEYVPTQDVVYGDIVGLLDTTEDANRYINTLLWSQIFKKAKSVRFIVALNKVDFQQEEYGDSDNPEVFSLLDKLTKLSDRELTNICDSILPVVTRLDDELDEGQDEEMKKTPFNLEEQKELFKNLIESYINEEEIDQEEEMTTAELNFESNVQNITNLRRNALKPISIFNNLSNDVAQEYK